MGPRTQGGRHVRPLCLRRRGAPPLGRPAVWTVCHSRIQRQRGGPVRGSSPWCNHHPYRGIDRSRADGHLERRWPLRALGRAAWCLHGEGRAIRLSDAVTHRGQNPGRAGRHAHVHAAHRDADRSNHGDRGSPAHRGHPDDPRRQPDDRGHREPAHAGTRDAVVDAVDSRRDAATGSREFRGDQLQREWPREPEQSVPGRWHPQQGRSRRRVHAGLDDHRRLRRIQRAGPRLRRRIRRRLRRHRQRGHQERDEPVPWQWVLLRSGRQIQRHQLLHEAGWRRKTGERQRHRRGQHRRADPPEQGVLLLQHRATVAPGRARTCSIPPRRRRWRPPTRTSTTST